MEFAGMQKLTLLDYPGRTACTLFTQGCDFRCPFCHNSSLLPCGKAEVPLDAEDVLAFLSRRRGILDGVCVTGGEPLMQAGLADFLRRVKDAGFLIKLDTNGTYPERLRALADAQLIDCVAMDVKNGPSRYAETCGLERVDLAPVRESVAFLRAGKLPCEFRTTVVRELHDDASLLELGEFLACDRPYFLQSFVDSPQVLRPGLHACPKATMLHFRDLLLPLMPRTELRGI